MNHLTDEQIYHLSQLITQELLFTDNDIADLRHIEQCDECYDALRCSIALMEVVDNIDLVMLNTPDEAVRAAAGARISAVFKFLVGRASALLEQLQDEAASWTFDAPLALAGARSSDGAAAPIEKLEDIDNSQTYLAYDPNTRVLVVQVECGEDEIPSLYLQHADGTRRQVPMEYQEGFCWAQVRDLDEGEYQIVLEK